jgi:hypothetical protein
MKNRLTVVIEYQDGEKQPSFCANMDVLGGKVVGVMFDDALVALEKVEGQIHEISERHE